MRIEQALHFGVARFEAVGGGHGGDQQRLALRIAIDMRQFAQQDHGLAIRLASAGR